MHTAKGITIVFQGANIEVSWHPGSDSASIEKAIRKALQLDAHTPLYLYDEQKRIVNINDALPAGLVVTYASSYSTPPIEPTGPTPWPFVGNVFDLKEPPGSIEAFPKLLQAYGGMVALTLKGSKRLFCSDADVMQDVLARPEIFTKIMDENTLGFGSLRKKTKIYGLFTTSDHEEKWQIAHRILLPGFGVEAIREYYSRMLEVADELLTHLDAFAPDSPVCISDWMTRMTFEAIGYAGFSTRFHCMAQKTLPPFVQALVTTLRDAAQSDTRIFPDSFYFMANRKRQKADDYQKSFVKQIIRERMYKMARGEVFKSDLLQVMLTSQDRLTHKKLPEENIADQLITFLIAGHETTSALLSYAIYRLIKHPEVAERLIGEVDAVLGRDYSYIPSYEDLNKLPFTLRFLKETLRLNPTVPILIRTAMCDTVVAHKYLIKKDETLFFHLYSLHRDPKHWPDPEKFDPDRFLPEVETKRHPGAYRPFGGGMRACIGTQFALKEAVMVLARLCQRYRFHFYDKNYQLKHLYNLSLKPKNFDICIEKRIEEKGEKAKEPPITTEQPLVEINLGAEKSIPLLFLYGSNMGHCQEITHKLVQQLQCKGLHLQIKELDAQVDMPWEAKYIIIVTSTYNGTPPDNGVKFEKWLQNLDNSPFADLNFSVLGVGNKQWHETFQRFPHYVDTRMQQLGARRFYQMGIADLDGDSDQAIEEWSKGLRQVLQKLLPMDSENIAQEVAPRLLYACEMVNNSTTLTELISTIPLEQESLSLQIKNVEELLAPAAARSTKHIEILVPEKSSYRAGDHIGILPENPSASVELAAKLCNLRLEDIVIIKSREQSVDTFPLNQPITVQNLLRSLVDLHGPVSRQEIRLLAEYCRCPPEQKKLQALADAEFSEKVLAYELNILDLCQQFRSIDCSLDLLLSARPPLKPRYYSISSSPLLQPEIASITVGVQEHMTKGNQLFKGVCSHYLARKTAKSSIQGFIKDTKSHFRLPDDPLQDIILIGPGTGLAPLRGFLQERNYQKAHHIPIGRQLLFFGCRHVDQDFIYRQELEGYLQSGLLQGLFVAFSRMPNQPKVYVQDLLRQHAPLVWEYVQNKARILVCGDGKHMAPAVRKALMDIFAQEGRLSPEQVREFFNAKQQANLYVEDVWAG